DHVPAVVLLLAQQRAVLVAQRNAGRRPSPLRHQDEVDPERVEALRLAHTAGDGVVRLPVGKDDQHAVGELRAGPQQLAALRPAPGSPATPRAPAEEVACGPRRPARGPARTAPRHPRAARRTRTRRAHAAPNHAAPATSGARASTNGASKLIRAPAPRTSPKGRSRAPARSARARAASGRLPRSGGTPPAPPSTSRGGRFQRRCGAATRYVSRGSSERPCPEPPPPPGPPRAQTA